MSDRVAPRRPAEECPWITGLRLSPGGEASLGNISTTGLMALCPKRLAPGGVVTVTTTGTFTPSVMKGRVARCEVGGIGTDGALHYKIGIVFDETVKLPDEDPSTRPHPAPEPEIVNRW